MDANNTKESLYEVSWSIRERQLIETSFKWFAAILIDDMFESSELISAIKKTKF